jgi:tetratricopeptide (TPR) repeat protein
MKKLCVVVALLSAAQTVPALAAWDNTKDLANKAMFWKDDSLTSLGFESAFHKPIHQKTYIGAILTGAAVVGAGTFVWFTAGAGAPAAGWGVSSVATWVGGGGAGSYMAGLSTIGGWFGGNAMLGSAILNGISIGVAGGGASSFASMTAIGKVGVMASVTASTLDGVALFKNPDTENLTYRIRLNVPEDLGSKEVRALTKHLRNLDASLLKADSHKNKMTYNHLVGEKAALLEKAVAKGKSALKTGAQNEDLLVLGVVAQNAGVSDLFEGLVKKVNVDRMEDTGYVDYLKAVASVERGDIESGTTLVRKSWRLNPYAVEPPLLLINILAHEKFAAKEEEIRGIVESATKTFNSNKYKPSYSLVSLNYRLATMYLVNKKYSLAQIYYEKAYDELSPLEKHWGSNYMKNIIRLGIANSMFGDSKKAQAQQLLEEILKGVKNDEEKKYIKKQYAGNI